MITVISGKLGSGKSYDSVRCMVQWLRDGHAVRTNIKLDLQQMRQASGRLLQPYQIGQVTADDNPKEIPIGDRRGHGKRRCKIVLDEALNWFASSQSSKDDPKKKEWGEWLRQSDKLGQDVFFIAQNFERSAKWIRELAQVLVEIVPLGSIRVLGIPLFKLIGLGKVYAKISYDVRSGSRLHTEFHTPVSQVWKLYDTSETFGFESADSVFSGGVLPPPFKLPLFPLLLPFVFLLLFFILL